MKILIVIDYFQPQMGYSESFFSREFVKQGHQVTVLTSNYYFPFPNYEKTMEKTLGKRFISSGEEKIDGIKVIRKRLFFEIFARAFFSGHEVVIKKFKPNIVLVNKSAGFSAVKLAYLKKQYKYKLYCYDSLLASELLRNNVFVKNIFYYLFRILFSGKLNNQVDKFIAVQEGTKDVMKKYFGIKKDIKVIPLGTDTEKFKFSRLERNKIRKGNNIKSSDFVIVYTGKIIEAKGVHILYQAFNQLCQKYANIKLFIVGDGTKDYIDKCNSFVAKKYHKNIIKVPFQPIDELYKYYSAADIAAWPLQDSTSMNDAASCSLVFIANDTLGDKLRISNNNAFLYKRGDYMDLVDKIERLYKNPILVKKMGENGRKLAEDKLSWHNIAALYLQL